MLEHHHLIIWSHCISQRPEKQKKQQQQHTLISCSYQVDRVMHSNELGSKLLQSITGILETVTVVFCMGANFMNSIRLPEIKSGKTYHSFHIRNRLKQDLKL